MKLTQMYCNKKDKQALLTFKQGLTNPCKIEPTLIFGLTKKAAVDG